MKHLLISPAEVRLEISEKVGAMFLDDGEVEVLADIFSRYRPQSFSKKIGKGSIEDTEFHAHGPEITEEEQKKMSGARLQVFSVMRDGEWRTLEYLRDVVGSPTQSIAIYLRSFREKKYGGYVVNKRKRGKTRIFEYQLSLNQTDSSNHP